MDKGASRKREKIPVDGLVNGLRLFRQDVCKVFRAAFKRVADERNGKPVYWNEVFPGNDGDRAVFIVGESVGKTDRLSPAVTLRWDEGGVEFRRDLFNHGRAEGAELPGTLDDGAQVGPVELLHRKVEDA